MLSEHVPTVPLRLTGTHTNRRCTRPTPRSAVRRGLHARERRIRCASPRPRATPAHYRTRLRVHEAIPTGIAAWDHPHGAHLPRTHVHSHAHVARVHTRPRALAPRRTHSAPRSAAAARPGSRQKSDRPAHREGVRRGNRAASSAKRRRPPRGTPPSRRCCCRRRCRRRRCCRRRCRGGISPRRPPGGRVADANHNARGRPDAGRPSGASVRPLMEAIGWLHQSTCALARNDARKRAPA